LQPTTLYVLFSFVNLEHPDSSARRFFSIAEALCRAVGNAIRPGFIQAAMAMLVVLRIQRVRWILLRLETRFLAGLAVRRPARVVAQDVVTVAPERREAVVKEPLPRGLGWLCPLVPSYAATYAEHMRVVLAEPGMRELLAACPQALRVLGPLCRMLGIARAEYVPAGAEPVVRRVAPVRVRVERVSRAAQRALDLAAEDAHYAITGVPRKYRLRAGRR
jgi:hypothetical protein